MRKVHVANKVKILKTVLVSNSVALQVSVSPVQNPDTGTLS